MTSMFLVGHNSGVSARGCGVFGGGSPIIGGHGGGRFVKHKTKITLPLLFWGLFVVSSL